MHLYCCYSCTAADPHSARRDFLSYCLSLMRAHNAEHLDSLPILDVSALKHIAYVFDALIYYMRSGTESPDPEVLRDGLPMETWNDQVGKSFSVSVPNLWRLCLNWEGTSYIWV